MHLGCVGEGFIEMGFVFLVSIFLRGVIGFACLLGLDWLASLFFILSLGKGAALVDILGCRWELGIWIELLDYWCFDCLTA
jgi:hypothetical protein